MKMKAIGINEGEKLVAGFMSSGLQHNIIDHIPRRRARSARSVEETGRTRRTGTGKFSSQEKGCITRRATTTHDHGNVLNISILQ